MKPRLCLLFLLLSFLAASLHGSDFVGLWRTIDDETREATSIVSIYEAADGTYEGKVTVILKSDRGPNPLCEKCPGERQGQPIRGMVILWGMEAKDGGVELSHGRILDPKKGKVYKAKLTLLDSGEMEVRGFIGFSFIGRSQIWQRVEG